MEGTRSRTRSTLGLTLGIALGIFSASAARAVDLTGSWAVFIGNSPSATIDFVQAGQQLSGTIQGQPGAGFSGSITGNDFGVLLISGLFVLQLQATVRADGNGFSGTAMSCLLTCPGGPSSCQCAFPIVTNVLRGCRIGAGGDCCGDGVVGPSEHCDPGPTGACCDAFCQSSAPGTTCTGDGNACVLNACDGSGNCVVQSPAPSGTSCADDANQCTGDGVCDGAGSCTHPPTPSGTPCGADLDVCTLDVCDGAGSCSHLPGSDADADGTCDDLDPCTNGETLGTPRLLVRGKVSLASADRVVIRGRAQFPMALAIDPPSSGMHVIANGAGWNGIHLTLLASPPVPQGTPGWTVGKNGRFRYRSPGPGPELWQAKVSVSARAPGLVKVELKGTGLQLPGPSTGTPVYLRIALAMTEAVTERCAEVTFAGARPDPVCTISPTKLSCR